MDDAEGVGGPGHQGEEEAGDDEHGERRPAHQRVGCPRAEVVDHHGQVAG